MPKGYEFAIFHCYECGEFRVRKKSGEIDLLEPCPKCETLCVRAMPFALDIEFTNRCGGQCVMCPRGQGDFNRKIGDLSDDTFRKLHWEIRTWNMKQPHTVKLLFLHMFGESIGHKRFVDWTNRLTLPTSRGGAGVSTTIVSTNGMPLNETLIDGLLASGLHRLIVSLDGVSAETSKKIRPGVKFERVQANVDLLLKKARQRTGLGRKIPSIWIQILKLNENEDEWLAYSRKYTQNPKLRKVTPKDRQYREIPGVPGGQVFFKTVERMGSMDELKKHKGWDGANRRRISCIKPWTRASIWWNGEVPSPACCYTADSDEILGSIAGKNSLHGVWLGPSFQRLREEFKKYQESDGKEGTLPELCQVC